jgi:hypothetical protein
MISKSFAVMGALALLSAAAYAGSAPPKELYGKSIIFAWTEQRSQRQLGQANFRDIVDPLSIKIYVSTTGRPFNRFASTSRGRKVSSEGVGASGISSGGGPRLTEFKGRTLIMTATSKGGLARRFTINFNENYSTCEAQVVVAKQAGSDVVLGRNLYTGEPQEIRSARVSSGPSCSVRDGNVFAQ